MQHHGEEQTRLRLLGAAGEVFAEKGFQRGTVREICSRAGANVAAVNYHFGGKKELYRQLLEHCFQEGLRRHPPPDDLSDTDAAEHALEAFIRSLVLRMLGEGRPGWLTRLMARELAEPTPALRAMVTNSIQPLLNRLMAIVRALLGPGAREEDVRFCALSVVGQCQHYNRGRPVIEVLFPDLAYDPDGIEAMVRHIHTFSISAMRAYRQE